ncbi:hypothetical protein [Actinomadura violacea]|uniref:Uncharacterized protein n=1 Tax=Actinomadura violacea TaxID=2819934 RepID=A0ABS3RWX5_9ACTN|nr:hypothetical protein [Actinomadura violacea]MBO2461263.1 hypothetical protein [Actinomadura violacea]
MNRLPVENTGDRLLCLSVEPYAEDFWLRPGESLAVMPSADDTDPQFAVYAQPNHLSVWIYESGDPTKVLMDFTVVNAKGTVVGCGYQRPAGATATASGVFLISERSVRGEPVDNDSAEA